MSAHAFGSKQVLNQPLTKVPDKLASILTYSKQKHEKDVCPIFKVEIKNQSNLSLHLKRVHNCQLTCSKCKIEFKSMEFLNEHLKTHCKQKTEKKQKTNLQSTCFLNANLKKEHGQQNTEIKQHSQFKCSICKVEFTCMGFLNDHIQTHKPKKMEKKTGVSVCPICKAETKNQSNLSRHLKRVHKKQKMEKKPGVNILLKE